MNQSHGFRVQNTYVVDWSRWRHITFRISIRFLKIAIKIQIFAGPHEQSEKTLQIFEFSAICSRIVNDIDRMAVAFCPYLLNANFFANKLAHNSLRLPRSTECISPSSYIWMGKKFKHCHPGGFKRLGRTLRSTS